MDFNPVFHVENSSEILTEKGEWPNFHDAEVMEIVLDKGDMRPDDDSWIGPVIKTKLELVATGKSRVVTLTFHDCDQISIVHFNHANEIYDIEFNFEHRGYFADGKTPLPPYIRVKFIRGFGVSMEFVCFRIEVPSPVNLLP